MEIERKYWPKDQDGSPSILLECQCLHNDQNSDQSRQSKCRQFHPQRFKQHK